MSLAVTIASWLCLTAGAVFCMIGALGLLRLPDLYARTHGATITDTLGAGLILIGLTFQAGLGLVTVKLLIVLVFLLFTSPAASHALVKAAHAHGVDALVHDEKKSDAISD